MIKLIQVSNLQESSDDLNQIYIVSREVKDKTGAVTVPADYSQLGELLIVQLIIGIGVPFAAIGLIRALRLRSA